MRFGGPGAENLLLVQVPNSVGEYEFSFSQNMTFVVGSSNNLIATEGRLMVD